MEPSLRIKVGYAPVYECPKPTPMLLMLNMHDGRASDIEVPDHLVTRPAVPIAAYRDGFGNWVSRIVAPAGLIRISTTAVVRDSGRPTRWCPGRSSIRCRRCHRRGGLSGGNIPGRKALVQK